ncbi:hypothetical protein D3C87_1785860 [compost metagenome]
MRDRLSHTRSRFIVVIKRHANFIGKINDDTLSCFLTYSARLGDIRGITIGDRITHNFTLIKT